MQSEVRHQKVKTKDGRTVAIKAKVLKVKDVSGKVTTVAPSKHDKKADE